MNILEFIKDNILVLDGGTGTLLQAAGLKPGEKPEKLNKTAPELMASIARDYFLAGSNAVLAPTFGVNGISYSEPDARELVFAAVENAHNGALAAKNSTGLPRFIGLDVSPLGKLLAPFGDLSFEDAVSAFSVTVKAGVEAGADFIFIETMNDSLETKAAVLAAKEGSSLPVFVCNAYSADGRLLNGTPPEAMVALLEGLGADAIGINCSLGPAALAPVVEKYLKYASVPVIFKPNAGLPREIDGKTVFDVLPEEFAEAVAAQAQNGVSIVGGCCGTTPEYIRLLAERVKKIKPREISDKGLTVASSYSKSVELSRPALIGERINPTGKKRFRQALKERDFGFIQSEALKQQEAGAHILDVNVGAPETDEKALLPETVKEIQAVCDLPLQIDSSDGIAMERALREYNGKAVINSVNGKRESMETVFPLAKKYGGVIVALTLDENGIPGTAEGRVEIANRILAVAAEYGIKQKDIMFDTLTMTVSADQAAPGVTLDAMKRIRSELHCHTCLGVSNVSFGLPERDIINGTFFALALENGLSAAIMNPFSSKMLETYYSFCALRGYDDRCGEYIAYATPKDNAVKETPVREEASQEGLMRAVERGQTAVAEAITKELIKSIEPLALIKNAIIPALDTVGKGFEAKTLFLPTLLMSAEAASAAFEVIKACSTAETEKNGMKIVLATVRGDIHDIGKNIVKLLLENYGFNVIDLGRDVPKEKIVEAVISSGAPLVGLSALMTTTVPAMEEAISLLREKCPKTKIIVGGAVLTAEYAEKIGADAYAADAMETVRYAEKIS